MKKELEKADALICEAREILESLGADARERFDKLSEKAQEGERGQKLGERADSLDEAADAANDLSDKIGALME